MSPAVAQTESWREILPSLETGADEAALELFDSSNVITVPANTTVFSQGDACENYLIVLDGKLKVFTRAENGREIVLYHLNSGDSCVLTTSCLFSHKNYPAEGETETMVKALAIPASRFETALQRSSSFRTQVFSALSSHLSDMIVLVEEVAFGKLDVRLAKHLLAHRDENDMLAATHQNIATELGSAREVISRQLKEFESRGLVEVNRGKILVKDVDGLQALATN